MPVRTRRILPIAIASLAGTACVTSSAQATTIAWTNPAGGSSTTLTNWSPQQVPGPSDSAVFGLGGSYIVNWAVGSPSQVAFIGISSGAAMGLTLNTPLTAVNCTVQTAANSSGTLTVLSGTLTAGATTGGLNVGGAQNAGGTLGGTLNIQSPAADVIVNANCRIGSSNDGFLNILGGGLLSSNAFVRIGDFDEGAVVVSGVDTPTLTRSTLQTTGPGDTLLIGNGQRGTLDVANGGLVSIADNIVIANLVSSPTSAATVGGASNGFNANMSTAANLFVGNNNSSSNLGRGRLTVNAGGEVSVALSTTVGDPEGGSGLLVMNGGILTTHDLTLTPTTGSFTFAGGTLALTGGVLTASGTIAPAAPATISGSGTLDASIANAGHILPSGLGFTLTGALSDDGAGVSGTRLTFAAGSSYTGDGNLSCEIQTLPGSTITPSGNLLIGNHASLNGVAIGGSLNVGPHVVELRDFNGAVISGTVNLAGGTLFNPSSVLFGGGTSTTLEGHGIVVGQFRMQDARLQPGQPSGDRTGHISFDSLNFDGTGIYSIEIEGEAPGQFDSISSGDEVELNGLRIMVSLINAYSPAIGTRFRVLTGSIVDDLVQLVDSPGFVLELVPGALDAVYVGTCDPVDFNGDGLFPDTADIDDFLSVFSGGPCGTGTCNDVDFNNDGLFPDTADLDDYLRVFSGGPCL